MPLQYQVIHVGSNCIKQQEEMLLKSGINKNN
jgi:hypothetical protein